MNYGASTHFNTPEYESYTTNRLTRKNTVRATQYTGCLKKNATEIQQAVVHHKRG